ncbi:hypothetical protein [Aureimonas sp. N4]|uniref:hypothetical protein n=1 Tax=Aureimonas sp. N4 TaxID=1638165 RepID=UPI000B29BCCA|nr:hypothetical protein [Aureimonas sp. N4]
MRAACPTCADAPCETPALRARAERVAAWRRPRPILEAAMLAASFLLCAAVVLGGVI